MRRRTLRAFLFIAALSGAAFLLRAPALALTEICPADLSLQPVAAPGARAGAPAALYGLQLKSDGGARSVGATLALDTNAGWFAAVIPPTKLLPFRAKMATKFATFEQTFWRSRKLYVDTGKPVTINHAFLVDTVTDDPQWTQRGSITCLPVPRPAIPQAGPVDSDGLRMLNDDVDLSAAPASGDPVLKAAPSQPLASENCAHPFVPAIAQDAVSPDYPAAGLRVLTAVTVEVALDSGGKAIDAWTYAPSGLYEFDNAAVQAAKTSSYTGAISYCTAVPSLYFFHVTFSPN